MTIQTKVIIGISVVAIGSYIGYKIYQNYQVNKHFPKKTNNEEEKSNFSPEFENAIRKSYKKPMWVVL